MTTREKLIQEISHVPEELVEELFDFLLFVQTRRQQNKPLTAPKPYALQAGEFSIQQNFDKPLPEEISKELKEISLMQIMDDIGYQAEKNGLTPEILESILANED
ncbi:MAG: hypothetical protein ACOYN8_18455 [Pseudanabaena sp.]|jgi:hypothetical protein